jgi:cobalt transporter subunit CbtA
MPLTALRRLLPSALLAGLAAGIVSSTLQQLFLVPLILRAEALETAAHGGGTTGVDLERAAYSLVFTCVGASAFALLLTGCWSLRGEVDWRRGLLWGLAGFAVFSLAPALGLPPELPGAHAADLTARQAWWVGTAVATAAGLWCVVFPRSLGAKLLGLVLLVTPHLVGAPQPTQVDDAVPAEMAHAFAFGSLAISAVMWLILGTLTPVLLRRGGIHQNRGGGASPV